MRALQQQGLLIEAALGKMAEYPPRMAVDCSQRANDSIPDWRVRTEHPLAILVAMTPGGVVATRDFKGAF